MVGGRRGSVSWLYEVIISLILLAVFTVVSLLYINANASGASYWSRVYAHDISTTGDIVNAAYGDVLLRYDNLKHDLGITIWAVKNGIIETLPVEGKQTPPPEAFKTYYGLAGEFPKPAYFVNPRFLAFRKIADAFALTDTQEPIRACPHTDPGITPADARVFVDGPPSAVAVFVKLLEQAKIAVVPRDEANIRLALVPGSGERTVQYGPTSQAGAVLACLMTKQLEQQTLSTYAVSGPSISGTAFQLTTTISPDTESEKAGRALALAILEVLA